IDGAIVSPTNVHLAARFARCVAISPAAANLAGIPIAQECATAAPDTRSLVITPDEDSVAAMGPNPFDASRRRAAAQAGLAQGQRCAPQVKGLWMVAIANERV